MKGEKKSEEREGRGIREELKARKRSYESNRAMHLSLLVWILPLIMYHCL